MTHLSLVKPVNGSDQQSGGTDNQNATDNRPERNATVNSIFRPFVNGLSLPMQNTLTAFRMDLPDKVIAAANEFHVGQDEREQLLKEYREIITEHRQE